MTNSYGWRGYADARPSESIQKDKISGLAVAVVFPNKPNTETLDIPVKQYKACESSKKSNHALKLAEWLEREKEDNLKISGFIQVNSMLAAANFGLNLIEELPDTNVVPHYNSFKLQYNGAYIDFSHAIALEYYYFAISLGVLRAGLRLPTDNRRLLLLMDRFPGQDTNKASPSAPLPLTDGARFIEYIRTQSTTGIGLEIENKSINLISNFGTLDWWKEANKKQWKKGKTHPHFILPDWCVAAGLAHEFREEFISSFKKENIGIQTADALNKLYNVFKSFGLWSFKGDETISHIHAASKKWIVPSEAKEFILERAHPPV